MSSATKVFLALFALLIGILVLYYGVWQKADPSAGLSTASAAAPTPAPVIEHRSPVEPGYSRLSSNRTTPNSQPPSNSVAGSTLLTDALLHRTGLNSTPPSGADSSLDALFASQAASTTSRPAANVPVAIGSETPTVSNEVVPVSMRPETASPTPTQPARSAPAQTEVEYTIKAGDTGTSIAKEWFGDPNKWVLISKANPWVDFNRLRIGQKLKLPPKDATSVKPQPTQPVTMGERTVYVVQAGDTLAAIARKQLGSSSLWEAIYELNKSEIGSDPGAIQIGMKLKLPEKSTRR